MEMTRYRAVVDEAHDQITKLLMSEWLITDVETGGGDRRRRELIRIRQIYIPELITQLHVPLLTSRQSIPETSRVCSSWPTLLRTLGISCMRTLSTRKGGSWEIVLVW